MGENMNKKVNLYRSFIVILLILIFISAFFMSFFYSFDDNKYIRKINANIEYYTDYKLINKDNTSEFKSFEDIENIDIIYSYLLTLNNRSKITNQYKIVGVLTISDGSDELLVEELFSDDDKSYDEETNVLNIKENRRINFKDDYGKYLDLISNNVYKDKDAKIEYKLINNMNIYSNYLNKNIKRNENVLLSIDLKSKEFVNSDKKKKEILYGAIDMKTCYAICGELLSAIVLLSLIIILLLRRILLIKSSFNYRLNKILNKYDDIIVNVKNLPVIDNKEIVMVTNFKELINVHDEVNLPINYLDIINNHEATFVIIVANIIYVYKMK